MTGQINVNKIAARSGTTITVDTGDALDVTLVKGEGTATTNLKQGLAKVWVHHNQVTSHSIYDSFNVSTLTDVSTGHTTINYTNNMANDDHAVTHHTNGHAAANNFNIGGPGAVINRATSSMDHRSYISSPAYIDAILNDNIAFGDLA